METTGNQEKPAIITSAGVMSDDLAEVIDCSLRRQSCVSPAVPEHQFPLSKLERVQVRVGGVEERSGQARVAFEIGKVVS
jgi:hypothetical protein